MTLEHLVAFNVALVAAIVSPGPALLVAINTTLSSGRLAGVAIGGGLGLTAATWTLTALIGLDTVFRLFPWVYSLAKMAGAGYLLYIAYKMWTGPHNIVGAQRSSTRHAFVQGLLVNLLNPKSVLFAAAVLVVVFPADMSGVDNAIIALNHLLMELLFYTVLAFAMSSKAVGSRYLRAKVVLDRAASVVLASLGLRLLVTR